MRRYKTMPETGLSFLDKVAPVLLRRCDVHDDGRDGFNNLDGDWDADGVPPSAHGMAVRERLHI
jgi:hypothetical protein